MNSLTKDDLDNALQRHAEAIAGLLDRRIDELAASVQSGFTEVFARLDRVDERLGQLEVRADKLEHRVDRMDDRLGQLGGELRTTFLDHDRRLRRSERRRSEN